MQTVSRISGMSQPIPAHLGTPSEIKMLESRSEDALVLLVKLVKSTVMTVKTVETVETVLTEDLKKSHESYDEG